VVHFDGLGMDHKSSRAAVLRDLTVPGDLACLSRPG
jgi:hypothetical protein